MVTVPTTPTFLSGRHGEVADPGDGQQRSAQVFEALDAQGDDTPVTVRYLNDPDTAVTWSMVQNELGVLDGFRHPGVVALLNFYHDTEREQAGIVLELVEGGLTLEQHVQEAGQGRARRKPLSWGVVQLLRVLNALNSVHRRRVLYRDVKLRNVLDVERKDLIKREYQRV